MLSRTLNQGLSRRTSSLSIFRAFSDFQVDVEHGRGSWKTYGDVENYKPGNYQIKTFNKISPIGLGRFPTEKYDIRTGDSEAANAHAILLRSHKLQEEEIPKTCRAIARCGAGTNNVPVDRMSELGIPVFNTPGANANAVKELAVCGMLLGSRRVIDGINHMSDLGKQGLARERVEKDKALFGGRELSGKKLCVIGLGHIGSMIAHASEGLGMTLKGYDPALSIQSALKLPRSMHLTDSIVSAVADADYISINIPYIKGEGGTHGIISKDVIDHFKEGAVLLNFARGELVDSEGMKEFLDKKDGRYVSDFPEDLLWDHENTVILPHLGASTAEAEDQAAAMAADTITDFLETGAIKNSVNFPDTALLDQPEGSVRFTVVNKNVTGMLAKITETFAGANFNILQQINHSRGSVAYNVVDVDTNEPADVLSFKDVQEKITMLDGVLSSRVIYGTPGTGYARNIDGEYFV